MKLASKTIMPLFLAAITSGLFINELSPPDYVSAAVPAPGLSQRKVIVKNLRMV